MTLIEQYLSNTGLVISDILNDILPNLSEQFFSESHVEFWTVTIPAKTDDFDIAYFEFPKTVFVKSFQNLIQSRCDDVLIRIEETIEPVVRTSRIALETLDKVYVSCHGNGFVVNRDETEKEIIIKTVCSNISIATANYAVLTLLKSLYMHLFIGDVNMTYRDLQRLSEEKKNIPNANVKNNVIKKNRVFSSNKSYRF